MTEEKTIAELAEHYEAILRLVGEEDRKSVV